MSLSSLVDIKSPGITGFHFTQFTSCLCAKIFVSNSKVGSFFLLDDSVSLNILMLSSPQAVAISPLAETRMSRCGCQITFFTSCVCAFNTAAQSNSSQFAPMSQTQTDLSRLQVARKLPVTDQATLFTSFSCPSRVELHSNSFPFLSQIEIVASNEVEARNIPQFENATSLIVKISPEGCHDADHTLPLCAVNLCTTSNCQIDYQFSLHKSR
ncbi:CLUMA_CG015811, isoform A [Clunio marinus]|uniref:CLUMA_CG015811, isoform A n=1 Tax=Clunio marinus TaxID=568069 RepID=A0A1J1IQP3_9DIPT|nr:CLUMA_CG015811, isoform A [Clunio marinus]